jgi:hypothetical protein
MLRMRWRPSSTGICSARSREAKKVFETALMESRRMSMSFITPEHILLAVLAVGDATSRRIFDRYGAGALVLGCALQQPLAGWARMPALPLSCACCLSAGWVLTPTA